MFTPSTRSCGATIPFFLCCVAMAMAISNQLHKPNSVQVSRLANGRTVGRSKAGFMVQIRNKREMVGDLHGNFICAGTIVSDRHVITAAHCLNSVEPEMLKVVLGQVKLNPNLPENKSVKTRGVQEIFMHPDYIPATFHADVAVLKLKSKISFGPKTWKADLCEGPLEAEDELVIYGWGRTASDDLLEHTNEMKEIIVPVLPMDKCKGIHEVGEITDLMMCAGLRDGQDACQGDSGGPAMFGNQLCGIVSWGDGCGSSIYPGIYTNVTAVRDFIDDCLQQ